MKIAYLLESTALCGGVKVVLLQAEMLLERGHFVKVVSKEAYPGWFNGKCDFISTDPFDTKLYDEFDFIILTSPALVVHFFKNTAKTKLVHLIQGYEGDCTEAMGFMNLIEHAYSLPIIKISNTNPCVRKKLQEKFNYPIYPVGQGIETEYFYQPENKVQDTVPDVVFLFGPMSISIKQIELGLKAFVMAKRKIPGLKLVRINQANTMEAEEQIVGTIHEYFTAITPEKVGSVLRKYNGVLLSPSNNGEGFGLPAIEAMACGVPTVLTSISSYTSFADKPDYARFVNADDAQSMAHGIVEIITDHTLREKLIKRGLEVAENFRYEKVVDNIERILKNEPQ
jgi:glycosyltransferase involved in cell wall biosynthesis